MTKERPPNEDDLAAALADAMTHPVQGRVLAILYEFGPKSARQISTEIDVPADKVRYHLRQLRERGLVSSAEEKARRGVVERFYRAVRAPIIDDAEYSRLAPAQKMRLAIEILKAVFADTSHALKSGALGEKGDHLTRVRLRVDDQGWADLLAIHRTAFEEVERVKAENDKRCADQDDCLWVTSALLCFVSPPKP